MNLSTAEILGSGVVLVRILMLACDVSEWICRPLLLDVCHRFCTQARSCDECVIFNIEE